MPRDVLNERKHVAAAVEAKRNPPPVLLAFFVFLKNLSQNRIARNPFARRIFLFSLSLNFGSTFESNFDTTRKPETEEEEEGKTLEKLAVEKVGRRGEEEK